MMQQEFEKLTKVKVTSEEYNTIEAAYMACQEDKQVFCKQWLKKDGIRNLLKDRLAEIKNLNRTIKELEKKIDTLEDWKPSIKYGTHYSDTSYRSLSAACERNEKICSLCSPMQRSSLLSASASTPQSSLSSRMWRPMSRTDTEMPGLQRPKPESPCMSVKASTMHDSMCFAKAATCSGNWLTASCVTMKVPISNLRGAIVSRT